MNFLTKQFALDISQKRGNTPLREIAKEINISASTLSRVEMGKLPDLITYATLCKWMGVSLNKYFDKTSDEKIADILREMVTKIEQANYSGNRPSGEEWKEKMFTEIDKI